MHGFFNQLRVTNIFLLIHVPFMSVVIVENIKQVKKKRTKIRYVAAEFVSV